MNDELKSFKTEEEIRDARQRKDWAFSTNFKDNLNQLNVKLFDESKYFYLYQMQLFPKQGVELLKTLLAYYFAFNKVIKDTAYVHRLPLMMDAIFKEDIDESNKLLILQFIKKNKPVDTQLIFCIAESQNSSKSVVQYNKECLGGEGNIITINMDKERAFLAPFDDTHQRYLDETLSLMD